ncbi:N-acetylglucosamine-6-phosphate deacetylase [Sphingomonas sp. AR_OL41]|uniref:N-acetylglucosamine-6-phosphate deacetylase n=1 Tax=Sphingomonas sp. AR_OL41 TaxID=3042729 RepID=UPI0024801940|nr:N-acetylglucosamine-6-phosphate deacetylase [Sphingomonas sp. AR_OL41]MDH7971261.1 N-acetylglucosamine-6-phosphate deacetylase [Sphingomonas sp. AR_OL41]
MTALALTNVTLVLPDREITDHVLLIEHGRIAAIVAAVDIPPAFTVNDLGGGWLLPGFIDTQVNGGGDVLFNDSPDVAGITAIAAAHRRFGTTGLLPTLISDRPDIIERAITAVDQAIAEHVPGVLGIHVEGPHLNAAKHGIHDETKFTLIDGTAIERLTTKTQGVRLVTLAPELAPPGAIAALNERGVIVAAGHSTADYDQTRAALREGLRGFTHLFNAMTQLTSRAPGMVGAAIEDRASWFGLIVDGVHVHPATLRIALAARGLEGAMLVTDAMPPVGGSQTSFTLMGKAIAVVDGTCRGSDGTLAGSALSMAQAFRNAIDLLGVSMVQASRMASGNAATFLGLDKETGVIRAGLRADLVHLDAQRRVRRTWIGGALSERGE